MEYANVLIKYLKEKYNSLETSSIGGKKNITRYTKPIMSDYVENAVALLIDKIKGNQLNYLIDSQLSVGNKIVRPDIIIYDKNNVIVGIAEVKSQLGYAGNFNKEDYNERIET